MESLAWGRVSGQRLRENITLLWLLGKEPEKPAENPIPECVRENASSRRQLTIERERDLVDTLAFLSASSDDPEEVIAVCVEEQKDGRSMTIRIAANSGDMGPRKEALKRIVSILEHVASEGHPDEHRGPILREIIAFNQVRILSRLRSKHAVRSIKNHNKTPIVVRLAEAVKIMRILARSEVNASGDVIGVEAKVKELQYLYGQLEAIKERQPDCDRYYSILGRLVKVAHSLTSQHDLSKLLNSIPNSGIFGPEAKASLPTAVGKLGRYYSSCTFLLAAARKSSIFKSIQVETVRLPTPTSPLSPTKMSPTSLSGIVGRILGTCSEKSSLSSITNRSICHPSAEANFLTRLTAPQKGYKIHAEIQLLFFYELRTEKTKPRVICSSKSACFLCNLFISIHARYYVARTHGVLYDKWSLPDLRAVGLRVPEIGAMAAVVERFNASIEDRIISTLAMPRLPRFHPNESVFLEPPGWSPSIVSLATTSASQVIQPCDPPTRLTAQQDETQNTTLPGKALSPVSSDGNGSSRGHGEAGEPPIPQHIPGRDTTDLRTTSGVSSDGEEGRKDVQPWLNLEQSGCASPPFLSSPRTDLQVDIASQRYSRSSEFSDASSPAHCTDAITPSYWLHHQGDCIERSLPTNTSPIIVSTKSIRLILSYDGVENIHPVASTRRLVMKQNGQSPIKHYLLRVRWLKPDEDPRRCKGTALNIVDLNAMKDNVDEAMSWKAGSPRELYFCRQDHIISVEFVQEEQTVDRPPLPIRFPDFEVAAPQLFEESK